MPIYEYYCADCRAKFDARRPMNQADAAIGCKHCESTRTSRVLSLFTTFSSDKSSGSTQTMSGDFGGCCGGGSCGCSH